jgi:hypothetical protein
MFQPWRETGVYMGIEKREEEGGRKDGIFNECQSNNSHRGQVIVAPSSLSQHAVDNIARARSEHKRRYRGTFVYCGENKK